jgi:hypothetical protein
MHGKEWFGKQFMRSAWESGADIVFVPDSGFVEEAEQVIREIGATNMRLIRVHRKTPDGRIMDFSNDSRSYIDLSHVGIVPANVFNFEGRMQSTAVAVYAEIQQDFYKENNHAV